MITFERDYDEARNEFFGLTSDPSRWEPEKKHDGWLSRNDIEEIRETACELCIHVPEYKDPDELMEKVCEKCKLWEKLEEFDD